MTFRVVACEENANTVWDFLCKSYTEVLKVYPGDCLVKLTSRHMNILEPMVIYVDIFIVFIPLSILSSSFCFIEYFAI